MKISAYAFLLSLLLLSAISCEKQEDESKVDFNNVKIDLSQARFGSNPVLLHYADVPELLRSLNAPVNSIISDSREIMGQDSRVTDIISIVNFHDGIALLTHVYYLDENSRTVVGGYILDIRTSTYNPVSYGGIDWDSIFNGGQCPGGYSELASCGNFNNPQNCVASAMSTYMASNLSGIGDCVNVQVKVGALNTRVCGKTY